MSPQQSSSSLVQSAADLTFRDEVRRFYAENLTLEFRRAARLVTWVCSEFEFGRRWQKILHSKGWGAPHWPVEYGGCDWTPAQRHIWEEETALANPPEVMMMGRDLCAPCIMEFGTPEQKAYFLPRLLAGDDWWAQGYSEPGAGSDLAALQMRADSDGDDYILNGSKIWTTYAQHSNRIFCLVRTSTGERKQQGITFLLVDMDTPGIEVRPLINIAGEHEFNQVFFSNARVPKSRRLGAENEGWSVARYLLRYEHSGGGGRGSIEMRRRFSWLQEIANLESDGQGGALSGDPDFSRKLAEIAITIDAMEFATEQAYAATIQGGPPPPSMPLLKIRSREIMQRMTELAMEATAYYGAPFQPHARRVENTEPYVGAEHALLAMPLYLSQRALTIAGGTPEIRRNNLAKSLLGLKST